MRSIPEIITDRLPIALLAGAGGLLLANVMGGEDSIGRTETVTRTNTVTQIVPAAPTLDPAAQILRIKEGQSIYTGGVRIDRYPTRQANSRYDLRGLVIACNAQGDFFKYRVTRREHDFLDGSYRTGTETITKMDMFPNHSICDDGQVTQSDLPATRGSTA